MCNSSTTEFKHHADFTTDFPSSFSSSNGNFMACLGKHFNDNIYFIWGVCKHRNRFSFALNIIKMFSILFFNFFYLYFCANEVDIWPADSRASLNTLGNLPRIIISIMTTVAGSYYG